MSGNVGPASLGRTILATVEPTGKSCWMASLDRFVQDGARCRTDTHARLDGVLAIGLTGYPIPQPPCHSKYAWQAYLTNGHDASGPLPVVAIGFTCDRSKPAAAVPVGESRLSFTTHATYFSCAEGADGYLPTPRCLKSSTSGPPLPAGRYRIEVTEPPYIGVPSPAPLSILIAA
ncbi:MAG TPA: hypothetical protein VGI86_08295 [Acidimicrobiia bacterium]